MKRKEWAILVLLISGVAALEVVGRHTDDMATEQQPAGRATDGQATGHASRAGGAPADSPADPRGPFRTARLRVSGMT
jgi:hypothetical protein